MFVQILNPMRFYTIVLFTFLMLGLGFSSHAALTKPVLTYPSNGSTSYFNQITIGLSSISGVVRYRYQSDTSKNFNSPLLMDSSRTISSYFTSLPYPLKATVYVRVKVYSVSDSSAWSDVNSVYISDQLKLTGPTNGFSGAFTKFSWYNVGFPEYILIIDTTPSFNSPLRYEKHYINLNPTIVKWDSFYFNTKYYWKVTATGNGDTMQSEIWSFTHQTASKILFPPASSNWMGRTATVAMKWQNAGMAKVEYQISRDPSFTVIDRQAIVSSYENDWDTAYLMDWNTKYYSRLRFLTAVDTLAWDMGGNQTTLLPRFTDPYTGKVIDFSGEYLSIYGDYDHVDTFQLQIDTNMAFINPVFDTFLTDLNYRFIPERLATTYYIRVRGLHLRDTSQWDMRYIKTADINYYGLWSIPNDKATNTDLEFTLQFSGLIQKVPFVEIELDTTAQMNSPLYYKTNANFKNQNGFPLSNLQFATTYYWRFRIGDEYDTSEWSALRTFTTWGSPINYDYPPNTARNWHIQNNLLIKKPSAKGIKYFLWQLDTTAQFNSPVMKSKLDTNTIEFSPAGYFYLGQEYYWRVAAAHDKDTSAWGPTWNYQTHTTFLNKPLNGAIDQPSSVKLEWGGHSDLKGYFVLIDTSSSFNAAWIKINSGLQQTYTISNLKPGKKYYWTILPFNEIDTGEAYTIYNFTTKALPPLLSPALYMPSNNAKNVDYASVYFSWQSYTETGILYEFQIASNSGFSPLLYSKDYSTTNTTITGFTENATYYWRVRYKRAGGETGPWSATYTFTTKQKVNAIDYPEPYSFHFYPNPATSEIVLFLPHHGRLKLFNMQGKIVLDKEMERGTQQLSVFELPAGIYYLEFTDESMRIIRKMIKE